MSKLTRSNLQEFCRTCLKSLPVGSQMTLLGSDSPLSYNIFVVPNLAKLMILFTSLNVNEEKGGEYPKSLCQPCYYKLLDFQEFRQLAVESAEELYRIVNSVGSVSAADGSWEEAKLAQTALELKSKCSDKDNLEPLNGPSSNHDELSASAIQAEPPIKTEPIDIDDSRMQTPPCQVTQEYEQVDVVKTEIDSEYEEEDTSTFYERNALGTSTYDSIGDDADDEEHALRNGAANTSSAGLLLLGSAASPTSPVTVRQRSKRDRNKKSLKCPRCDKQVYKQVYLDAHIRGVHEGHEKPFLCLECQKAFTRYNQLHVHIQANHLMQQKFECEFDGCEATFKMSHTLETHRKLAHIANATPLSLDLQEVIELHKAQLTREIEMDHVCQQCCKKYSSKRALSEHLKRHAQIKEHVCTVCGVAKVTRTELQTHMRTHEPNLEKFKCSICPQEFNHKNAISRHVRVVHEGQRRFTCRFCAKRFGTRNSQVCHERLHTGERPFNCELCSKGFAQLEGLKSHMKNHDKTLRKHVCSYCSQRFITKKSLVDHEGRHRGDKPHICNLCSRGFFNREDLTTHRKLHVEAVSDDGEQNFEEEAMTETAERGNVICGDGSSQSSN